MKKKLFLMIAVLCCMLLLVGTVAACEDKGDTGENPGGDVTENPGGDNPGGENPGGDVTENPEPEVYYTVTFDTQGGSAVQSVQAKEGATIAAPASPTKDRYNFTGWYKNIACTEPWDFAVDTVNGNITLYAGWTGEDGKILAVENATISGMDILLPVRESVDSVSLANAVTIGGKGTWRLYRDILGVQEIPTKIATGASGRLLDGDNVFYIVATSSDAQQIWTYTLTVHRSYQAAISIKDPYGDVHDVDSAYTYFETYSPDYSFDGYTVNSWTSSDPVWSEKGYVTGETSFTPVCTPNKYTATLDANNGSLPDGAENTVSVTYDQTYRFPVPSRKGYTFNGWELFGTSELITDNKGVSDGIWEWLSDKTVRANWTINSYSVAAVAEDDKYGTVKGAGNYNYDSYVTLEAVTNAGYVFIGWYDGDDVVGESEKLTFLVPDENLSYTAKWETDEAAKAFTFTSTPTSFTITAINDKNITSVVLPDYEGVSITIGENAYDGCTALTTLSLSENVVSIGGNAFRNCTGLTSVTIPDSVTSIGAGAFSGCSSLESITIPFVGAVAGKTSKDTYQYPFGYIFGTSSYTGGTGVKQYYYDYSTSSTTYNTYYIPSSLRNVTVTGGNILYGAFYNCSMLTSVTIPDSVTSIGGSAFSGCTGLTSVTIPDSVTSIGVSAFYGCTGLTSVTIPDSVTSIGDNAFSGCYKLVEVYNKSSLNIKAGSTSYGYVGYYAKNVYTEENGSWFTDTADGYRFLYDGTKGYLVGYYGEATDITLPGSFSAYDGTTVSAYEIYQYAFYKNTALTSVTIGNSVESIGGSAFYGCRGLTSVTIPDSVTSIESHTFYNCTGLTSVTIGNSVTSIGNWAFYDCSGLTSVTIPDSVTSIGEDAFSGCTGLTSVTIPDSVIIIGEGAFSGCSSLESITIPFVGAEADKTSSDTYQYPFGYIFGTDYYAGGTRVYQYYYGSSTSSSTSTRYYIPSSLRSVTVTGGNILYGAFSSCSMLTSVTIPDSVTSIGYGAFYNCTGLTSVTIGNSVTSIGSYAFEDCTGLTSVTIGNSVTSIERYAFSGCTGLTSVEFGDTEGWQVSQSDFSSYTSLASTDLADASTAATYLMSTYRGYYWRKI